MTNMIDITHESARHRQLRDVDGSEPEGPLQYVAVDGPAGEARDLAAVARQLWRRRWMLVLITLLGTTSAAAAAWSLPSRYIAEARLLVGIRSPQPLSAEKILADVNPDAERVQNESLILQSRTVARQVARQLHLADDPYFNPGPSWSLSALVPWMDEHLPRAMAWLRALGLDVEPPAEPTAEQRENRLVDRLLSGLDVATLGRSHALGIKAEAADGATAAAIANAFADNYLEYQRAEKIAAMERVEKFLTDRIDALRLEVQRSEQAVEDYRRVNGLYKSGSGSVATQQLKELNSQLMAAQSAKGEALSRLQEASALARSGLGNETVPDVLHSPLVAQLKQQQADAERRASETAASYGDRHPAMRAARAESAAIAGRLAAETDKIIDGLVRDARAATARYDALLANFENAKAEMGAVNDKSIQLEALERDATVNRNLLKAMLDRAKKTIGSAGVVQADARIISPAAVPVLASFPPTVLIVSGGCLGALLIAMALAMTLESNDRSFRRRDQLENLTGLPVLATVPQVRGRTAAQQPLRDSVSVYGEALRRLLVGVELSQPDIPPKIIMLGSAVPGEGKSVMAASLGRQLAASGKRVVLIDCDWRNPRLHQIFRCDNTRGVATVLAEPDALLNECLHLDAASGLHIMAAGRWEPRMLALLGSQRMAHLLAAFAAEYDMVIVDSPPVLVAADALALARLVEKVVFVVHWGRTPQDAVLEALKQLIDVQAELAGIVLSRVVPRQFRHYAARDLAQARPVQTTFRP
jgi:capsular exopolysaccharide synthesis family protein